MSHVAAVLVDNPNVYRYDSESTFEGTSHWISPSLARGANKNALYTIMEIYLEYEIPATITNFTLTIDASGDGGSTWEESKTEALGAASSGVKTLIKTFQVTGQDPRIRIRNIKRGFFILGIKFKLIEREKL